MVVDGQWFWTVFGFGLAFLAIYGLSACRITMDIATFFCRFCARGFRPSTTWTFWSDWLFISVSMGIIGCWIVVFTQTINWGVRTWCLDLWYASQRRGEKSRRYLQALKLWLRLNGVASLDEPFPQRPKRMHQKTYDRLHRQAEILEADLRENMRFRLRETDYSVLVPK